VTLEVSKLVKDIEVNSTQEKNILFILLTFPVLNLPDKVSDFNDLQLANNDCIFSTAEVSNLERSKEAIP